MNYSLKLGSLVVVFSTLTGAAWAASAVCARPADINALQSISVQQELMVSGLSCEALPRYNAFQTAFQPELRSEDRGLMQFMRRIKGARGEAEYHAFKTRAANMAQLRYIHDPVGFCSSTKEAFASALDAPTKPTLAAFVSTQPIYDEIGYSTCDRRAAGDGATAAPANAPVPLPKPTPAVFTAQQSAPISGN